VIDHVSYRILDIELSDERGNRASLDDCDVAAVLRYHGYPVGFQLHEKVAERPVSIDQRLLLDNGLLERLMARAASDELPRTTAVGRLPKMSIAICTRDRPGYLARCLESLERLAPGPDRDTSDFEVLVVDNAPSDEQTRDVVARHLRVRYLRESTPGLNFARNAALREARGDLIAYLDDDVVVDRGWLAGLVDAWRDQPDAGFITGQVLPLELATAAQVLFEQRGGFRRGFEREYFGARRANDRHYPCGAGVFGTGANMALNRRAALAVGGFDIALDTGRPLPGGGDLDMFYRLIRAGHGAVYEPGYLAFHHHRPEMAELRRQYRDSWGKSLIAFAAKSWAADTQMRGTWSHLIVWWFGKQIADLARSMAGRSTRPVPMILAELQGGFIGLVGEYGRSRRRVRRISEDAA
jgi:GT2 family glycosyltransferase